MPEFSTEPDDEGSYIPDPDEKPEQGLELTTAAASRTRQQAAIAMWVSGANYAEVAERMEFDSPAAARQSIERGLAAMIEPESQAWQAGRHRTRLRLDALLATVWEQATTRVVIDEETSEPMLNPEQLQYHRAALSVIDRITNLEGLNAPSRHVIYSPDAAEFDQVVKGLLAQTKRERAEETDPFALEDVIDVEVEEGDFDAEAE